MRGMTAQQPRHVLMTADAVGGVWQYATDLACGLAAHGIRVTLAVLGPAPGHEQQRQLAGATGLDLQVMDAPLDWLAEDAAALARVAQLVGELARDRGVDLLHLNTPALAAFGDAGCPMVGVAHSCVLTWWRAVRGDAGLPPDLAWRTAVLGRAYGALHALVAPSAAFAADTWRSYRLTAPPAVIHNGRRWPLATGAAPAAPPFAFFAGRLWDGGKGAATLDAVAARTGLPVLLAGPDRGPHGAQMRLRHARSVGVLNDDGVRAYLAARPIFMSCACYEPFGLAVLEAAQAGCPLLLSDIPTFRELWDGAARFVAPGDSVGFSAALAEMVADEGLRAAAGAAARDRAQRYSLDAMVTAMARLYRQILSGRHAAPYGAVA